MGKFDGILICTDLDGTLISSDATVSKENIKAINYFKSEGGKFTFVTGRVPRGAKIMLQWVAPNTPIVVFNGAGVFDIENDELLWGAYLNNNAKKIVEYVQDRTPDFGLVVCTDDTTYFPHLNDWVDKYYQLENIPLNTTPWREIKDKWKKALFVVNAEYMPIVMDAVNNSGYKEEFDFVRSCANYYEILPKGATKGAGLIKLSEITGIALDRIIAVGDNENDLDMIKCAGVGIAVGNATDTVKEAADFVTVTNDENAIAKVINDLDNGIIRI